MCGKCQGCSISKVDGQGLPKVLEGVRPVAEALLEKKWCACLEHTSSLAQMVKAKPNEENAHFGGCRGNKLVQEMVPTVADSISMES